ncbi:MAG TPA: tRNA guanosine(34) transglycosylase Tgt [Anaerolineales bacterium]|nr:tRNA guanosine(34) transglycosylase Tgt [Anaerolineales bacterium]
MQYPNVLELPHGHLNFPAFLPDGTRGVVRAVSANDLAAVEMQAVVMNTFHLMLKPGASTVGTLGGLHQMSGWDGPIMTDSGGFQAYSLIRENPKQGSINNRGLIFRQQGGKRKYQLTPEKTIQLQIGFGADIVVCLDDCTHAGDDPATQAEAVDRTIRWAISCREEFDRLVDEKGLAESERPKLFAVVQGGGEKDQRKRCAEALLEIGFDGYGYGGWPLDEDYNLLEDMLGTVRELIPAEYPLHALGVGHPEYVAACARMGYQMFDSALPTRDARRGRLYTFTGAEGLGGKWFKFIYMQDEEHIRSAEPISPFCDCETCAGYSRGYLHHLFKLGDHLFYRLATIHNLRFMRLLEDRMRAAYG